MDLDQDGVNVAFDIILDELKEVIEQLRDEGARAFKEGKYDEAPKLGTLGKELEEFKQKLSALQADWNRGFDRATRARVKPAKVTPLTKHTKSKKTVLAVSFPSGKKIQFGTAAETFVATLEELGIDAVRRLGETVYGVPLVGMAKHEKYDQHRSGNYYVVVHSSTADKKTMLETVARKLGQSLQVGIKKRA